MSRSQSSSPDTNDEPVPKSKTRLKQEMHELQQLGVKLCALHEKQLQAMDLPENLLQAILEAKRLKSHGAIRRQAQYIGKIMRQIDSEPIFAAYLSLQSKRDQEAAQFHRLERWRSRLMQEGSAAQNELLAQYPNIDASTLKQLVDDTLLDFSRHRNTGAKQRLFQFLKKIYK